jgi:site-specific DNA recombinase
MDKAVIYARVSSKEQEIEGYSIPAQIKLLKEYSLKNNLSIKKEFTDIETAKKAGRTQFNAMLNYLKENPNIKTILVEKTDRLLRNISDYASLNDYIEIHDIKVHLVKENVLLTKDSRSNEKFIFGIKALMAKNYVDNLSEEVKKGMLEKANQGIYPSTAPYGYKNVAINGKRIIEVDTETAPFVKKMFELYATGSYSLLKLRKKMLADGLVYKNGKNFTKRAVEVILKNSFYTGVFVWKGKTYHNASHEPIISKELFNLVQRIKSNPYKSKSRNFPYTNLIKCGVCGCALTAEIKKEKYVYYHCTGYKGKCKQPYLRQEVLEETFENLLNNIQISDEIQNFILKGIKDSFKDKIKYHNSLVNNLEKQIKVLQNRIDNIYLDKLDGKISEEFWQTNSQKWKNEKENLLIKLSASQKADSNYLDNVNLILELSKKAAYLFKKQNHKEKRRLISLILSNSTYKDGKLDLQLKKPFDMIIKVAKSENWRPQGDSNPCC